MRKKNSLTAIQNLINRMYSSWSIAQFSTGPFTVLYKKKKLVKIFIRKKDKIRVVGKNFFYHISRIFETMIKFVKKTV